MTSFQLVVPMHTQSVTNRRKRLGHTPTPSPTNAPRLPTYFQMNGFDTQICNIKVHRLELSLACTVRCLSACRCCMTEQCNSRLMLQRASVKGLRAAYTSPGLLKGFTYTTRGAATCMAVTGVRAAGAWTHLDGVSGLFSIDRWTNVR